MGSVKKAQIGPGRFLNVDVRITSTESFAAIAEGLEPAAFALHSAKLKKGYFLSFESNKNRFKSHTPDNVIKDLCGVIGKFSARARLEWDRADARVFDIGFDAESISEGHFGLLSGDISTESLRLIFEVGGSLAVTVYRNEKDDGLVSPP